MLGIVLASVLGGIGIGIVFILKPWTWTRGVIAGMVAAAILDTLALCLHSSGVVSLSLLFGMVLTCVSFGGLHFFNVLDTQAIVALASASVYGGTFIMLINFEYLAFGEAAAMCLGVVLGWMASYLYNVAEIPTAAIHQDLADTEYSQEQFEVDGETAWQMYDKRLAEIEIRAFRAYIINYQDSIHFDRWSQLLQWGAAVLIGVGAILYAVNVAFPTEYATRVTQICSVLLPSGGLSAFIAKGPAWLVPAVEGRAQKNVQAGSEWFNIHRLAKLRRLQLRQMNKENDTFGRDLTMTVSEWYEKLAEKYCAASKITPLRESTYNTFKEYDTVKKQLDNRNIFLKEFMKDQSNSDEPRLAMSGGQNADQRIPRRVQSRPPLPGR